MLVNAQTINKHTIGVRVGFTTFGNGGGISYQLRFTNKTRVEIDAGIAFYNPIDYGIDHYFLSTSFHWNHPFKNGVNLFIGPSGQIGYYESLSWAGNNSPEIREYGTTYAGGIQAGIGYDFKKIQVPLQVSIDTKQLIGTYYQLTEYWGGVAVSFRYII